MAITVCTEINLSSWIPFSEFIILPDFLIAIIWFMWAIVSQLIISITISWTFYILMVTHNTLLR